MTAPAPGERPVWAWACLGCGDGGAADSQTHALSLERLHQVFACPAIPGLDRAEKARRQAWRDVKRDRYERHIPPETAVFKPPPEE